MLKIYFVILFVVYSFFGIGQFSYTVTSDPDSVLLLVNNKEECYTPCKVNYYWKQAENGKMIFTLKSDRYDLWSDTISEKPYKFDNKKNVVLKKSTYNELEFDSTSALVAFDKVLANFKDGERVGDYRKSNGDIEPINWEGSIKIGSKSFDKIFYEKLTNAGYNTLVTQHSQLFSEEERRRPNLPRYIVGVKILDIDIQLIESVVKSYGAGKYVSSTRLKIEWQVLDKSTDAVILRYINEGDVRKRARYRGEFQDQSLEVFEMALLDFIHEGQLFELVNSNKNRSNSVDKSEQANIDVRQVENPEFESVSAMIKYVSKSCVTIITDAGHGSGVVISADGHVITANHVLQGVNKIQVKISEGIELAAELISTDVANDVALLKINGAGFQPLPFSITEQELGDEVFTIGTPADIQLGQSISRGMISGKRIVESRLHLQVDMAVSPGNSGGPLINKNGEVIGIIQKKVVGTGIEGIGFALPIDQVLKALQLRVVK